ncbi:MAG: CDP-diacylglycerol--glycerol-3-phosphate 3-phosphatidyltransferase [Candidatus Saganbacteria bacterium]|nr:CDP-diacylglycerol--glycerol-3-phosphate 3-phosphatidyltransferase [Candidatus Saganbacteria bacterium]
MNLATLITLCRILIIPFIIFLLLSIPEKTFAAFIWFLIAALTDWLDGFVARKFKQTTALGAFLDPLADKLLVLCVLVVLVELGKVSSIPVVLILIRELSVMGLRIMAANKGFSVPAEKMAKVKTVVQIAATAMLILGIPMAEIVLWLAVLLSLMSGAEYLWILKA